MNDNPANASTKVLVCGIMEMTMIIRVLGILGAGTHFFYFTADKLPAGTYYYTIEFPQGVVIASKTMLVVK